MKMAKPKFQEFVTFLLSFCQTATCEVKLGQNKRLLRPRNCLQLLLNEVQHMKRNPIHNYRVRTAIIK